MVKNRRRGFTFRPLAPIRTACRKGRRERMNAPSSAPYSLGVASSGRVALNLSREPSSPIPAARLKAEISRSPQDIIRSLGDERKNSFILSMSAAVRAEPLFTVIVSPPAKLRLSLTATGGRLSLVTSEIIFPSFSSIILSP